MDPRITIVIGNYNGATTLYKGKSVLENCIVGLQKTDYKNYKVVLVDDCSSDNGVDYIKQKFSSVVLLKNKSNLGFAKTNNTGIRFSLREYKPEFVLLLNNDIIISNRSWLRKLVSVAESDKEIGIVGCKLVYPNGKIQCAGAFSGMMPRSRGRAEPDKGQYDKTEDLEAVTGAAFLIKRSVIEKIGLLDENYFMGCEDIDYCVRARKAGFRVVYDGSVELTHLEGYTSTNSNNTVVRDVAFYTSQRNYMYFALKHFNLLAKMGAVLIEFASSILNLESKDRVRGLSNLRLKSRPFWRLRKTVHAVFDGYTLYSKWDKRKDDYL